MQRKESKSYSALQKVIDEAATVIPFDDPLLKIARCAFDPNFCGRRPPPSHNRP